MCMRSHVACDVGDTRLPCPQRGTYSRDIWYSYVVPGSLVSDPVVVSGHSIIFYTLFILCMTRIIYFILLIKHFQIRNCILQYGGVFNFIIEKAFSNSKCIV